MRSVNACRILVGDIFFQILRRTKVENLMMMACGKSPGQRRRIGEECSKLSIFREVYGDTKGNLVVLQRQAS